MKIHHFCVLSVLAAALSIDVLATFAADPHVREELTSQSADMRPLDHARYNPRIEIHKPAVLPKGIVPAKNPIKFPRNEKIRIAEPRAMAIAEPIATKPENVTRAVPLAQKPIEKH